MLRGEFFISTISSITERIAAAGLPLRQPGALGVCPLPLPATIMGSCIRTPGANLMLEQQEEDTGSAVALMSCFAVFMGSLGMAVISQEWGDTVKVLGAMNILVGFSCLGLWVLLAGRSFVKRIPKSRFNAG